jgi:hypothetical protein
MQMRIAYHLRLERHRAFPFDAWCRHWELRRSGFDCARFGFYQKLFDSINNPGPLKREQTSLPEAGSKEGQLATNARISLVFYFCVFAFVFACALSPICALSPVFISLISFIILVQQPVPSILCVMRMCREWKVLVCWTGMMNEMRLINTGESAQIGESAQANTNANTQNRRTLTWGLIKY